MTSAPTLWWLPLAAAAAVVWAAALWPVAARDQLVRGRFLAVASLLAVAVVTPLTFVAGPHVDPRRLPDPADLALPGWLVLARQAVNLLLVGCLLVAVTTRSSRTNVGGWLVVAFAAFCGAGLVSAVANGNGLRSAMLAALAVAPVVVLWTSGQGWAEVLPVLRWALRLIVLPSLVLAAVGPGWAYWPAGLGRTLVGIPQLVGATEHPNALGPVAATLLVLEVARPRRRLWQWWAAGAAAVLVLAQSRTAWTSILVAALFAATVARRGWGRWLAAAVAIAVLGRLWTAPSAVDFTGRPAVWAYAWQQFTANPLVGGGPGFLEAAYRGGRLPPDIGWMPRHAHNQVLQAAAATGVVGLVTLGVLLVALVVAALRAVAATGGVSVAVLGILATRCVTEVPLSTGVTGFLLTMVLFAVLLAGLRDRLRADGSGVRPPAGVAAG